MVNSHQQTRELISVKYDIARYTEMIGPVIEGLKRRCFNLESKLYMIEQQNKILREFIMRKDFKPLLEMLKELDQDGKTTS